MCSEFFFLSFIYNVSLLTRVLFISFPMSRNCFDRCAVIGNVRKLDDFSSSFVFFHQSVCFQIEKYEERFSFSCKWPVSKWLVSIYFSLSLSCRPIFHLTNMVCVCLGVCVGVFLYSSNFASYSKFGMLNRFIHLL